MKYLIITIFLALFSLCIFAQPQLNEGKHQIGLSAGFTTGHGFAYKYINGKFGFQTNILPLKYDEYRYVNLGLTGFYTIKEMKVFKSYLFLSNCLISSSDDIEYNIGFGSGFSVGKKFVFNFMLGYGMFDINDTFNLLPTIEMGVFYKL